MEAAVALWFIRVLLESVENSVWDRMGNIFLDITLIKIVNIKQTTSNGQVSTSYFALTKQYINKAHDNVSISDKFAMQTSVGGVT